MPVSTSRRCSSPSSGFIFPSRTSLACSFWPTTSVRFFQPYRSRPSESRSSFSVLQPTSWRQAGERLGGFGVDDLLGIGGDSDERVGAAIIDVLASPSVDERVPAGTARRPQRLLGAELRPLLEALGPGIELDDPALIGRQRRLDLGVVGEHPFAPVGRWPGRRGPVIQVGPSPGILQVGLAKPFSSTK